MGLQELSDEITAKRREREQRIALLSREISDRQAEITRLTQEEGYMAKYPLSHLAGRKIEDVKYSWAYGWNQDLTIRFTDGSSFFIKGCGETEFDMSWTDKLGTKYELYQKED